jgi:outer membrane protein TolC
MKKIKISIWILLLSGFTTIYAQENQNTFSNVDEIITVALNKNQDLNTYLLQQQKSVIEYKKDRNYILPTISGTLSYQNNLALSSTVIPGDAFGQPGETIETQIGEKYNYNAGINLSKTIMDKEARMKAKISEVSTRISQAETEVFKQLLIEQTAFYYYSVLVSKRAVVISKEDLIISDSISKLTINKYNEGLISLSERNQATINRNNVQQSLLSNKNIYYQSLTSLKQLLGVGYNYNIELTEDITKFDTNSFSNPVLNVDKNLEVSMLHKEQSELAIKKEKQAYLPKLSLNGYFGKQQWNEHSGFDSNNDWSNYSFININASIPIFEGFSKKNKLKIAKLDNEIAIQNFQIEQTNATTNDLQLLDEYERNKISLKITHENYKLTKENTDLALLRYEQGLLSLDAYFKLYDDYLSAENLYLNSLSTVFTQYSTILSRQ